ncbi:hypothetical protein D3C87_493380 [compost metagenome]
MFRHTGKGRTYSHNLKLASILSGVAGTVNIAGVLYLGTLTTNVTGHFAFFSEVIILKNYKMAAVYMFYILFFFLGAFVSGILMELVTKYKYQLAYVLPISFEIIILILVGIIHDLWPCRVLTSPATLSLALLFAMGLQNALVTKISLSVVRTTHLTGIFTDLGIELSQLFFYNETAERKKLHQSVFLKLMIIASFFTGGIIGGVLYLHFGIKVLLFPAGLLLFVLWYDQLLFRYYFLKRKFRH